MNFDWQRIGAAAQLGATLLAALGAPIIAWLVYSLNKSNSAFARAEAARNRTVELNKIKLSLLERRVEFIKRLEDIFDKYHEKRFSPKVNSAKIFNNGIHNLKSISKTLFNPDIYRMLDSLASPVTRIHIAHILLNSEVEPLSDKDRKRASKSYDLSTTSFENITRDLFTSLYEQTRLDVFDGLE